ncbi:MAG: hypothetical protein HKL95_08655 [Phycisphaerae bacterium]|nr:hypothetical protein [Phycisphaerae bacterium]
MNSTPLSLLVRETASAAWPAVGLVVVATSSWLAIAGAVHGGTGWIATAMPPADMFAGWLMVLMLFAAVAAIMVAARTKHFAWVAVGVGWVVLALVLPLVFAAINSGTLPALVVLRIVAILAAWILLCTALVRLLLPLGPSVAVAATATLAMVLLALPVALMPLLADMAKLQIHWPLGLTVNACPVLWLLDGTDQALRFNWFWWSHARLMYQFTGLGQNTPMPVLQPWWLPTGISAALAMLILVLVECPINKYFSRRSNL